MNRDYIEQHNIIERYVLGRLSEEELEAFEDLFVFDPALREEIDATARLIQGARGRPELTEDAAVSGAGTAREPPSPDTTPAKKDDAPVGEDSGSARRDRRLLPFAIAANVFLASSTLYFALHDRAVNPPGMPVASVGSYVNPRVVELEVARSARTRTVSVPAGTGWVNFAIGGAVADEGPFLLRLESADGPVVLEESPVHLDPGYHWIEWHVRIDTLAPGDYRIVLARMDTPGAPEVVYPLQVIDAPGGSSGRPAPPSSHPGET